VSLTVEGDSSKLAIIGEAAHIAGERPGAARHDPSMTAEERDHYDNLLYLCANHHVLIDKQEEDYPTSKLNAMKISHEESVRNAINEGFAQVGFQELEYATQWIASIPPESQSRDFTLVPPDKKIKRNELTPRVRPTIEMGLSVASDVRDFVQAEAKINADFPERLKAGFLEEYYRLRKEGKKGDELFDLMCSFAQRGHAEQARRSAGLAVLVYLFEACEVFEK
jgi:hypothetical protein